MNGDDPFAAPAWLPGGHAQTIYPYLLPRPAVAYRRERIAAPDGDFWDFDWVDVPARRDPPAIVVLFHGLEGSSESHYARALMARCAAAGIAGVIPHFRGCGGELNHLPRAYHSGDHEEVGALLAAVNVRLSSATIVHAVGVSLGGSALVNWLGRTGPAAAQLVTSAAAISAPLDLTAAGFAIDRGANRIYARHFLRTLLPKARAMAARHPGRIDVARLEHIDSMHAFDDAVTAPLHGFDGVLDYWHRASAKPWLREIGIPTWVLNARNDPFVPADSLPGPAEASGAVALEQPAGGGHVGFPGGPFPGNLTWLPRRLLDFFGRTREPAPLRPPARPSKPSASLHR
jgi:predicted alpha/beta-fold hydrolase